MPPELKRTLEDAAHQNRRSLNAEIVARLEASVAEPGNIGLVTSGSELVARAMDHVRDQPQIVSREEARARLEQLQLNEQQRQAVAAVLAAAMEVLGVTPQPDGGKNRSNGG